jgi:hypothetical protein
LFTTITIVSVSCLLSLRAFDFSPSASDFSFGDLQLEASYRATVPTHA